MTQTILHRNRTLTSEMIAAARMLVMIAHPDDASLGRALERCASRLLDLPWTVDLGILTIASASNPGDVQSTDGTDCSCPAERGVCWHMASWHILSAIAATGITPVAPIPAIWADEDDLPAESFLDGPFDMFDDDSLTGSGDEGREWYSDIGGGEFEEVDRLDAPVESQETQGATEQPFYEETPVMVFHALPRRRAASTEMVPAPGSEFARLTALCDELAA